MLPPVREAPEVTPGSGSQVSQPAVGGRRTLHKLRLRWSVPLWLLVGGVAMALFFGVFLLDYFQAPTRPTLSPLALLLRFDVETAQNALGNLAQVVVAVLGIVITVVSIVVQLAATRYTPRIATLFFLDNRNRAMLGFFVVTCILSLWVSLSVSRLLVPRVAITLTLGLVSLSLMLIIPYFAYVFNFLDPERIVLRIRDQTLSQSLREQSADDQRQLAVLAGIEQLSDIAVNAITGRDQLIASSAIDALKDLGVGYLPLKGAQSPSWFRLSRALRASPDLVSMAPESLHELAESGTWLEWKVLRQLLKVYAVALSDLPDIGHLIAIDLRYLTEAALEVGDRPVLRLGVKFFNTFLRSALNVQNVRSAYNVLYQYRMLAEKLLDYAEESLLIEIAEHWCYYAQLAHNMRLGFVTETIAYDLAALCELSAVRKSEVHDPLLAALLGIDQAPETEAEEVALRGVRKAQIKLATAYLAMGNEGPARQIFHDMEDEQAERLRSIRDELLHVHSKEFWEIVDRGSNFDYLDPTRKEQLKVFFSWFPQLIPAAGPTS